MRVLITGSAGLIGAALARRFAAMAVPAEGIDLRAQAPADRIDVRDKRRVAERLSAVSGIIHLAAVSRVIDGEREPARCWETNVDATRRLLDAALQAGHRPWFIYASSREVYGLQDVQPVPEDAPLRPINVYARSKAEAEQLVGAARAAGLRTSIVRFANVYGSVHDHRDRVVPAFISAAVAGGTLRVDGGDCSFDLNHVEDVVRGVAQVAELLEHGEHNLPALHFVSGRGITLLELAQMACDRGDDRASIVLAAPRSFDVHHFVGDPQRARAVLGWQTSIDLETGLARLASEFAAVSAAEGSAAGVSA